MKLADVTWTDADEAETALAVLPVGSTEQHGPHAPLGTDTVTATSVAEAGVETYARTYGGEAVIAPPIPVGVAEEHRDFAGTLWVSEATFRSYVRDVVGSLAHHGFDRVVLCNGHGGNVAALREVCARITRHDGAYAVPFTWFDSVAVEGMGHGGPAETAFLRHVAPDLVREGRVDEAREGATDTWGEWVAGVNLAYDSAEFTDSGVVGDPGDGDAAMGEELLAESAAALADLLDAVATRAGTRFD